MSHRDSKALLIGGLIVAFGWIAIRAVPSGWASLRTTESAVEQRAELVARGRAQLDAVERLEETVAEYEAMSVTLHRRVLAGWDQSTAQFDLARRLRTMLGAGDLSERAVTAVDDSLAVEGLRRVSVRASVEANMALLVDLLRTLERDPTLGLDHVALTSDQPADVAQGGSMAAQLLVTAWFVPDTTRAGIGGGGAR